MIDEDILRRFGQIWPRHVGSLTQFLIDRRRHFDGDLDLLLVMCVVGDRTFAARNVPQDFDYAAWKEEGRKPVKSEDINVRSIADFSGIPKETVRRKLALLEAKGWITRDGKGFISATPKARQDLEPLTLIGLKYLSAMRSVMLPGGGSEGPGG